MFVQRGQIQFADVLFRSFASMPISHVNVILVCAAITWSGHQSCANLGLSVLLTNLNQRIPKVPSISDQAEFFQE